MNEEVKLKEAKYFLNRMKEVKANYEDFVFNLSAFISAARSIAQYMHNETSSSGNLSWYESKMSSSDVLRFFKSTRDLNIHLIPCKLQKNVEIRVSTLNLTASIASTSISSSGTVVFASSSSSSSASNENKEIPQAKAVDTYKFDPDWYDQITINEHFTQTDKELCKRICQSYDVITFCEAYINKLEIIMNEGISAGIISG